MLSAFFHTIVSGSTITTADINNQPAIICDDSVQNINLGSITNCPRSICISSSVKIIYGNSASSGATSSTKELRSLTFQKRTATDELEIRSLAFKYTNLTGTLQFPEGKIYFTGGNWGYQFGYHTLTKIDFSRTTKYSSDRARLVMTRLFISPSRAPVMLIFGMLL